MDSHIDDNELEFEINFTDLTLCEADGNFEEVKTLMESEFPYSHKWSVATNATITTHYGIAELSLNCNEKKEVIIVGYNPSIGDVYYNPDVGCLSSWCMSRGWNTPEPSMFEVKNRLDFWKHFWETHLINSRYLDETYGHRETTYEEDMEQRD